MDFEHFYMKGIIPKKEKQGTYVTFYMDKNLLKRIEDFASDTGQTKSQAVERIVNAYLKERDKEKSGEQQQ